MLLCRGSTSVDLGDIDNDGDVDVVMVFLQNQIMNVFLNIGDGSSFVRMETDTHNYNSRGEEIGYRANQGHQIIRMADVDGDMDLDIAIGSRGCSVDGYSHPCANVALILNQQC
eukprot:SAG31_NODE_340_length_17466_cov_5.689987_12_plen_114_part_00